MTRLPLITLFAFASCPLSAVIADDEQATLRNSLLLHASFDESEHADFARGERQLFTAESMKRTKVEVGLASDVARRDDRGRFGACLHYPRKTQKVTFFQGGKNVAYQSDGAYATTISFWMSLSPDQDLEPGYVDPLQITDKKWNDAAIFVDFSKDSPRQFRLGVYSDFSIWNPDNRKYEEIPESERPLISVDKPPFRSDKWTHVVITMSGINAPDGKSAASLYLDGEPQGTLDRPQRFSWQTERVAVMLGIYYVGRLDDFAMFDRAISPAEVKRLYQLPRGIKSLSQ